MAYPRIIAPGDAGYAEVGPGWVGGNNPRFNVGPGGHCTFTFDNLTPGIAYRLALGYPDHASTLDNMGWSVAGTAGSPTGTLAESGIAGQDFVYNSVGHQYLPGTFTPTGTSLALTFTMPATVIPTGATFIEVDAYVARNDGLDPITITVTGPASTLINAASTDYTATPDRSITATWTPVASDGGTFVPPSLTWSGSSTPQTFTYTPDTLGSQTIGGTPSGGVVLSPTSLAVLVNQGIHLASAHLTPSRQQIECLFADEDNLPVLFTTSGALADGCTWTINGGSPIDLTTPLKGGQCGFVVWPVCEGVTANYVIDDNDGGPNFTTTGTWANQTGGGFLAAGACKNDQFRTAAWSSPSATATYTFTGLTPGRFDVLALLWEIVGPDRTANALYTVKDGSGTTLGSVSFNQTPTLWPHFDREIEGLNYTRIGAVVLPSGQSTITVTLSQTGPSGILATDAIGLRRLPTPPATDGDVCTITIPADTIISDAGPVVAATDFPVTLVDDSIHMPFNATRRRTMVLGYNLSAPNFDSISLPFADRGTGNAPWHASGGSISVDSDGELTEVTSTATTSVLGTTTNGIDNRGLRTFADGIALRFEFDFVPTLAQPAFDLAARSATHLGSGDSTTYGMPVFLNTSGNHWRMTTAVHFQPWTPVSGRSAPFDAHWNPTGIFLQTNSVLRNLQWFDGTTPVGYPYQVSQIHRDRIHNKGFGPIRLMDEWGTNGSPVVDFSDFPPTSHRREGTEFVRGVTATPTSIRPYDRTGADADGVQAIAPLNIGNVAGAVMTFAAPHGFKEGQHLIFEGPVVDADGLSNTQVHWDPSHIFLVFPGPSDTELICFIYADGVGPYTLPGLNTLADTVTFTDSIVYTRFGMFHPSYYVTNCAELGLDPWINIPHGATDACCAALVDMTLESTSPGTKVPVEYSNEVWNGSFNQSLYVQIKANQYAARHAADPVTYPLVITTGQEWFAHRSSQHFDTALARAALVGRAADIVRVLGAQASFPGSSSTISVPWMAANGKDFDRLTIEGYIDLPTKGQSLTTIGNSSVIAPAIDRLDEQGHLDLLATTVLRGDQDFFAKQHRAILDNNGFTDVKLNCYEAGFSRFGGYGTVEPTTYMSHLVAGDPRAKQLMLAVLQHLDEQDFAEWCRYTLDYNSGAAGVSIWCTYPTAMGVVGTGTPGENANPLDYSTYLSQEGAAHLVWAAGVPASGDSRAANGLSAPGRGALLSGGIGAMPWAAFISIASAT